VRSYLASIISSSAVNLTWIFGAPPQPNVEHRHRSLTATPGCRAIDARPQHGSRRLSCAHGPTTGFPPPILDTQAAGMQMPIELVVLALAQDGLVTRRQVIASGITIDALRHTLGPSKRWQRVVAGIYATFTGVLQERHLVRAALLYAGEEAMVTGTVACRAYGLQYVPSASCPEILVPEHVQRAPIGIAKFRRTRYLPTPRNIRSFPCAPPERAVLDACRSLTVLRPVRALLCEVVQRGLTIPDELLGALEKGPSAGSAWPRRVLADVIAGCRSAPECETRDLVSMSTVLDEPAWNEPLPDPDGSDLRPDAHWKRARLALEVDSIEWHRFGDSVEATERRRARYAALGWTVLPVSPRRIREEPAAVLAEIEAAFLAGLARNA
jgi:hypothetical protein